MAKKKSPKERIDALINALGAAEKPSSAQIRNELVALALDAENLEDGQALAEKDARISDLETALERSDVQLGNLKVLLEEAGEELKTFRAEQKQREEKEQDPPEIQVQILRRLPSEYGRDGATLDDIARDAGIPSEEAEVHLDRLEKAGRVKRTYSRRGRQYVWHRAIRGSELIVAKGLAGNLEEGREDYKHPDRPRIQHAILVMLAGAKDGLSESEITKRLREKLTVIQYHLTELQEADMASDGSEEFVAMAAFSEIDDVPVTKWELRQKGREYVVERDSSEFTDKRATVEGRLSAIEEKILSFLAPVSSGRAEWGGTGVRQIAEHVNTGTKLVEDILEKLRAAQLVDTLPVPKFITGGLEGWARTDAGDAYLAKHGLLP